MDHNGRDLIYNPVLTNELIYDSEGPFSNRYPVRDLRINKVKGIISVEYAPTVPWSFLQNLTATKLLGMHPIRSYIPNSDRFSVGTISSVSLNLTEDIIMQWLKADPMEVVKVERLRKRQGDGDEWVDSETIKLTFDGDQIPKGVLLCGSYYKTRLFIPFPTQCWNCQRLGHTSGSCKSKIRCRKCAGSHNKKDCTSTVMKCANCNGTHNANSRDCLVIKKATKLEKDRILEKHSSVATPQPTLQMNANNLWPNLPKQREIQKQPQDNGLLYSEAVAGPSKKTEQDSPALGYRPGCSCSCRNSHGNLQDREFFSKLKKFVLEIFSILSAGESEASKSLLANSALRNTFGIDLTRPAPADGEQTVFSTSDLGRKRPLNSTDEILSEDGNYDGILSDQSLSQKENKTELNPRKGKKKRKKRASKAK